MTPCCKDCPALKGDIVTPPTLIRAFDVDFYYGKGVEGYQMMMDNYFCDYIRPQLRPSSLEIFLFMLRHTKHNHNDPIQRRFTYEEAMAGAGIQARSTMWEALAQLEDGLEATENRPALTGHYLIDHITGQGEGNLYGLNLERTIPGQPMLFGIQRGNFTQIHHLIIDVLMKLLTHQQFYLFFFIWRLTIGYQQQSDKISMTYFKTHSGISRHSVIQKILKELAEWEGVGLITIEERKGGNVYSINKNLVFDQEGNLYHLKNGSFFVIGERANVTGCARQCNTMSAPMSQGERANVTDCARQCNTPNHVLNHDLNKEENKESKHQPTTTTLPTIPLLSPITLQTDEAEKSPVSEQLSSVSLRSTRSIRLRELGIMSDKKLKIALDNLEAGLKTDEDIEKAKNHLARFPGTGGGVYAYYFCMDKKADGTLKVPELYMWQATPSLNNESDAAPKSVINGNGVAPHSPTSPYTNGDAPPLTYYTNGHGRVAEPPAPTVEADYLEAWADAKRMLKASLGDASYNGGLHYAKLVKMEGDKFVIAAPPLVCQMLEGRLKNTITRALHSAMKYKNMPGNWYIEFISNEKEKV